MGQNQVKLVEGYLKLREELETAMGHESEIIKAKMEGIVFAYETYTFEWWDTFEYLLERYAEYAR